MKCVRVLGSEVTVSSRREEESQFNYTVTVGGTYYMSIYIRYEHTKIKGKRRKGTDLSMMQRLCIGPQQIHVK